MPNNLNGAKEIMQKYGINSDFIDKAVSIVTPLAGIAGINTEAIKADAEKLKNNNAYGNGSNYAPNSSTNYSSNPNANSINGNSGFNIGNYPDI